MLYGVLNQQLPQCGAEFVAFPFFIYLLFIFSLLAGAMQAAVAGFPQSSGLMKACHGPAQV